MNIENYSENVKEESIAAELLKKYPGRIPLIAMRHHTCSPDVKIEKTRYLVPKELELACIHGVIRRRLYLNSRQSLFLFCNNMLIPQSLTMAYIYDKYAHEDGFLYIYYTTENAYG